MRLCSFLFVMTLAACGGNDPSSVQSTPAPAASAPAASAPAPAPEPAPAPSQADQGTRCATFVERSRPVLEDMARQAGKEFSAEHADELRTQCENDDGSGDKELVECVLAASDTAAVTTCWSDAMNRYIERSNP